MALRQLGVAGCRTGMSGYTRKRYPLLASTFRGPSVRAVESPNAKETRADCPTQPSHVVKAPGLLNVQPRRAVVSNEPCSPSRPDGDIDECIKELPKARPPFDHAISISGDGQASRGVVGRRATGCSNSILSRMFWNRRHTRYSALVPITTPVMVGQLEFTLDQRVNRG
jgi:hypothetical protein